MDSGNRVVERCSVGIDTLTSKVLLGLVVFLGHSERGLHGLSDSVEVVKESLGLLGLLFLDNNLSVLDVLELVSALEEKHEILALGELLVLGQTVEEKFEATTTAIHEHGTKAAHNGLLGHGRDQPTGVLFNKLGMKPSKVTVATNDRTLLDLSIIVNGLGVHLVRDIRIHIFTLLLGVRYRDLKDTGRTGALLPLGIV